MNHNAIDGLPPGDETPVSSDPLATPPVLEAIDPVLAFYRDKIVLKQLLSEWASLGEIKSWMWDFGLFPDDELFGHFLRALIDHVFRHKRQDEFIAMLRAIRPDMFVTKD